MRGQHVRSLYSQSRPFKVHAHLAGHAHTSLQHMHDACQRAARQRAPRQQPLHSTD
jgi:hypothetical protein